MTASRIHPRWYALLIVVSTLAAIGFAVNLFFGDGPSADLDAIESVEIQLDEYRKQKAVHVRSESTAEFQNLIAVLKSAEATSEHKCGPTGRITLRDTSDRMTTMRILAGHNKKFYEFRVGENRSRGIFRVEREPFLAELGVVGLNDLGP